MCSGSGATSPGDGYTYDIDTILTACAEHGVAMEMNGSSGRLDLNSDFARLTHQRGVKIVMGSDAHSTKGLDQMIQLRRAGFGL